MYLLPSLISAGGADDDSQKREPLNNKEWEHSEQEGSLHWFKYLVKLFHLLFVKWGHCIKMTQKLKISRRILPTPLISQSTDSTPNGPVCVLSTPL